MAEPMNRVSWNAFRGRISFRLCLQLLIMCVLGCLIEGRPRTLKRCGRRDSQMGKIVGGKETQPGEYPWQVSIHWYLPTGKFEHRCGGTILNEHYIVTAAHCIKHPENLWMYEIYTGLHQLSKNSRKPAKMYKISEAIIHEDYNSSHVGIFNDIALLRTKEPIRFDGTSGYVNGICLPYDDKDPIGWAIVTGWGVIKDGNLFSYTIKNFPDVLQAVKVPLVSRKECFEAYQKNTTITVEDMQICAGIVSRDSCQGDSGGPLVQKDKRGIYTLIGSRFIRTRLWLEGISRSLHKSGILHGLVRGEHGLG